MRPASNSGCVAATRRATRAGWARRTGVDSARLSTPQRGRPAMMLGIERGAGDADLRIGGGHRALGGGDVGPALQHVRRHAERHRRRRHGRVGARAPARSTGAGVPVSVAIACSNCARWRRSRSTWVSVVSSSACCCATSRPETAPRSWREVHELERAALQRDRPRQHVELGVDRAQVEVGGREVGGQQQPRCSRGRSPTARPRRARPAIAAAARGPNRSAS